MALETLKGIDEIGGFPVDTTTEGWVSRTKHIHVNHEDNIISFRLQNGPIKEVGENGCQVDCLIDASGLIISRLNEKCPCEENEKVQKHLIAAHNLLLQRKERREKEGNEGYNREVSQK